MKSYIIVIMMIILTIGVSAHEVYNINRDWKFFSNSEINSDGAPTVNLPHIWNNDALSGKKDYFRGIGNYLKNIDIPAEWNAKRVFIKFFGANTITNLMVNGKNVGEHRGGTTAFVFEITHLLNFGEKNFLWAIVNNSPQLDILPTAGDANSYGGIFRDVELIVTDPITISPLVYGSDGVRIMQSKVSNQRVEGSVEVNTTGVNDQSIQALVTIMNDKMDTVASVNSKIRLSGKATVSTRIPFEFDNPILWNGITNPYLYKVGVKLVEDNITRDSMVVETGFRYFGVDSTQGFMLNGAPYPIKGVVVHQDRASVGPALTQYQVIEDLKLIGDMGANAVRLAGGAHHPDFYTLCDKAGIIVWSELPFIGAAYLTDKAFVGTPYFMDNGRQQLMEIIYQQYNHPSVMMWGLFSELSMRGDDPSNYLVELNRIAKNEDQTRLTVANSNQDGAINFITDLIVWNHYYGWKEGLPGDISIWMDQLKTSWAGLNSGVSYSAGASIYHQEDSLYRPAYMGNWHPERWQTHLHEEYFKNLNGHDELWGLFVGNMFDYGATGRNWGEGNGINDCGLVTFDRKYQKDAYYFYKANWNKNEPFIYIAEKRWYNRKKSPQSIKVYSNCSDAELFVRGESHGFKSSSNGTIIWDGIELKEGLNYIEVRSGALTDRSIIMLQQSNTAQHIK